jgi:hypothetical protein
MNGMIKRPLLVDFEAYTDNDPEFKKELVVSMIDNLQELQQCYETAVASRDTGLFSKCCHKVKVTLVMLQDPELDEVIGLLQKDVLALCKPSFDRIIKEIIGSLLAEK